MVSARAVKQALDFCDWDTAEYYSRRERQPSLFRDLDVTTPPQLLSVARNEPAFKEVQGERDRPTEGRDFARSGSDSSSSEVAADQDNYLARADALALAFYHNGKYRECLKLLERYEYDEIVFKENSCCLVAQCWIALGNLQEALRFTKSIIPSGEGGRVSGTFAPVMTDFASIVRDDKTNTTPSQANSGDFSFVDIPADAQGCAMLLGKIGSTVPLNREMAGPQCLPNLDRNSQCLGNTCIKGRIWSSLEDDTAGEKLDCVADYLLCSPRNGRSLRERQKAPEERKVMPCLSYLQAKILQALGQPAQALACLRLSVDEVLPNPTPLLVAMEEIYYDYALSRPPAGAFRGLGLMFAGIKSVDDCSCETTRESALHMPTRSVSNEDADAGASDAEDTLGKWITQKRAVLLRSILGGERGGEGDIPGHDKTKSIEEKCSATLISATLRSIILEGGSEGWSDEQGERLWNTATRCFLRQPHSVALFQTVVCLASSYSSAVSLSLLCAQFVKGLAGLGPAVSGAGHQGNSTSPPSEVNHLREAQGLISRHRRGLSHWGDGITKLLLGEYRSAQMHLMQSIELCPNLVDSRLDLSKAYQITHQMEPAIKAALSALALCPQHQRAIRRIASILEECGGTMCALEKPLQALHVDSLLVNSVSSQRAENSQDLRGVDSP